MGVRNAGGPPRMIWYILRNNPDPQKLRKIYEGIDIPEATSLQEAKELEARKCECFFDETKQT
jgi:hypothetical protein